MQFLALLLLVGLTAGLPFPTQNAVSFSNFDDVLDEFAYQVSDYELKTEVENELRKQFDELLEKVKEELVSGNGLKEETIEKLKEFREQLRDLKIDVGKHAKEFLEKLKEKMKDYWKRILDKLNPEDKVYSARVYSEADIGKELRERFDDILLDLKDGVQDGMFVDKFFRILDELREIHFKLRNLNLDISKHAKGLLEALKDNVRATYQKILDRRFHNLFSEVYSEADIGKELRERFDDLLLDLKDGLEDGMFVDNFFRILDELREIHFKLRNLNLDISKHAKGLLEALKDKVRTTYQKILDRRFHNLDSESLKADIHIFDFLKRLKKLIKEKFDAEELKEKVEKFFGKGSELTKQLFDMLRDKSDKGKKKILDWIDKVLDESEQYSVSDVHEKIRNFFKDRNIVLKEKFIKFGEWVKEKYAKGLEKGRDRYENIKKIARHFLADTKQISKDLADEALEFFREHKEELGKIFEDIRTKVKNIKKDA